MSVGNSGWSQIVEGLGRDILGECVGVRVMTRISEGQDYLGVQDIRGFLQGVT